MGRPDQRKRMCSGGSWFVPPGPCLLAGEEASFTNEGLFRGGAVPSHSAALLLREGKWSQT
jgi:hypothetical protein